MKLFKSNTTKKPKNTIVHLEEEDTDYESFIPWKNSFAGNNFFEWLRSKFDDFHESEMQNDKNIIIFKNQATFAFRINTEVLNICPSILWNYWKDEVVDTGYILKNSEREYSEKQNTLRYYLKPRLKYKVEQEQLFGNITLELLKSDGKAKYIMMKCTWYVDRNFKDASDYKELLKVLTN
jgi:hypothetical protein